jgi:pyruvate formate lyase activating enzyme
VIIPGINDREEVLDGYLSLIQGMDCVTRYELLGFHTMGFFKYEKLGVENHLKDTLPMGMERLAELQKLANQ